MRWQWLSAIDECVVGSHATGRMIFPADAPFFQDHFPGFPVVPGVLLLEAMAQLSGKLIGYTVRLDRGDWPFPIISMMNGVKFRRFVRPAETLEMDTRLISIRHEMAACQVRGRVGSRVHVQAEQIFVFNAVPLEDPAERDRLERLERAELRRLWPAYPPEED